MNEIIHIWETHAIHVGTRGGPLKHGIDNIDEVVLAAIEYGHPSIAFIIHTPRLTKYRYPAEIGTDIKFIRGDTSYFKYSGLIAEYKEKYRDRIEIRCGVELEWQGVGLGVQWSRSKLFQAAGIDFVIGSIHFSDERIPYDDSKKLTDELIRERGSLESFWEKYLDEMIVMVDSIGDLIQVVGHLDLPKLYSSLPPQLLDIENSDHVVTRRLITLLEMIKDRNLALDVNLAGITKGCGVYPAQSILKKAYQLNIPITIGTDTHSTDKLGSHYAEGIEYVMEAGYKHYLSFKQRIPENRPLGFDDEKFDVLNTTVNFLNQRFPLAKRQELPSLSFGGVYSDLCDTFDSEGSLGVWSAIRARRGGKTITISSCPPSNSHVESRNIYFHHTDEPGTLSLFFSILASEEINIETAQLSQRSDGTGEAIITVGGNIENLESAIEFAKGTAPHRFINLKANHKGMLPNVKSKLYIHEVDGVELPIPLSEKMIVSVHRDAPGVLLTLLAGLATVGINVNDLRLGKRGELGHAVLGISGDTSKIPRILSYLGPEFRETSIIEVQ